MSSSRIKAIKALVSPRLFQMCAQGSSCVFWLIKPRSCFICSLPFSALTLFPSSCRCTVTTATPRVCESSARWSVCLSLASSSLGHLHLSPCLFPWRTWKTPPRDPSPFLWADGWLRSFSANSSLLTAGCSSARYPSSLVGSDRVFASVTDSFSSLEDSAA